MQSLSKKQVFAGTRWWIPTLILVFMAAAVGLNPPAQPANGTNAAFALPPEGRAALAREMGRHDADLFFQPIPNGYAAQQDGLTFQVTRSGFQIKGSQGNWGLNLTAWGSGTTRQSLPAAQPAADGNHLRLQRGALQEWYANTSLGMEHGFTIAASPSGKDAAGPLTLVLEQSGDLSARVDTNRQGLSIGHSGQDSVYQYDGLMALDAAGKPLTAWFEMEGGRVLVRVEDEAAQYPIMIDPWAHCARLLSTDMKAYDDFGASIAMDGNTVVVGAPRHDVGGGTYTGRAYVFQKPEQGWSNLIELAVLSPTDWSPNNGNFGYDVAISKNTIFVLDPGAMVSASVFGAVYVYARPTAGWTNMTQTARLTFTYTPYDYALITARKLAVSDDALFVGVPGYHIPDSGDGERQGAVFVFVRPQTGWVDTRETMILTSPDWSNTINGWEKKDFGASLAATQDTLAVGAPGYYQQDASHGGGSPIYTGIIYLYKRPPAGWGAIGVPDALLTSSQEGSYYLGQSMDIQGDTVAASAQIWEEGTVPNWWDNTGRWRVYVFARQNPGWLTRSESASLEQSDAIKNDTFGFPMDYYSHPIRVSGDMVAVGCPNCSGAQTQSGTVYIFSKPQKGWDLGPNVIHETTKLWSHEPEAYGFFGMDLAVQDNAVLISQFSHDDEHGDGLGAVYVLAPGYLRAVNDGPTPLGSPTHFRAQGSLGGVTSYHWDFGDGTTATGDVVNHQYAAAGTYTAVVEAINGVDQWSASTTVEVTTSPVPGWNSAGQPGFGSANNQVISSLTVYGQNVYAGTTNDNGGQLWQQTVNKSAGADLMGAAGGWTSLIAAGFGNSKNTGINHLFPYNGRLFAGTVNEAQGGEIWQTQNGSAWQPVIGGGLGEATNGEITRFEAFNNQLYAATWSYSAAHGAELWRSASGLNDWQPVERNGFGSPNNQSIVAMTTFRGRLYAGTVNYATGGQIWRSANGANWTQVNRDGFGSADQPAVSSMAAFDGWLYASLYGYNGKALQVWRCQACEGTDWQKVVDEGFGNSATRGMSGLLPVGSTLYLAVGNRISGMEVWYTLDGTSWSPAVFNGFGSAQNVAPAWGSSLAAVNDRLWVGTWNTTSGGQLWQGATAAATQPAQPTTLFLPLIKH